VLLGNADSITPAITGEANRKFLADLKEHTEYTAVVGELKKQLLAAVPDTYLAILADDEMGYADISCGTMLAHLQTTYGIITAEDLETNRNKLSDPWNFDWPQEDLPVDPHHHCTDFCGRQQPRSHYRRRCN
jgi:hypothetical protein